MTVMGLSVEAEKIAHDIEKLDIDQQLMLADRILNGLPGEDFTNEELMEVIREREEAFRLNSKPTTDWDSIKENLRKRS